MSRYRLPLIIALAVLVLDQATKLYIDGHLALYQSLTVVQGFFNITYVRNKGAAFGIFADSAVRLPFFIGISVLAAAAILWYLGRISEEQKLLRISLSLILAGALGNLIDRLRLGEVIDFLDAHWHQHHWPAFNVADSAITVGVALWLLDLWLEERRRKRG
ncbi:MAG: signal peptidase II [Desulfuromonadales bacterium]